MSLDSHLVELERKHRALDEAIEQELAQPASSDLKLAELKRKKLQLKDAIIRLRQGGDSIAMVH
jgi:hypothetical protein